MQGEPRWRRGKRIPAALGTVSTVKVWGHGLPLGTKRTAHRNVPKMEEAITVAHSDCTARGGKSLIINLGVLIFENNLHNDR